MSTASLRTDLEKLGKGEELTMARNDFLAAVDEEDKIIYMAVARKIAEDLKCEIHVHEDAMTFIGTA